jgi:hypothetical protein
VATVLRHLHPLLAPCRWCWSPPASCDPRQSAEACNRRSRHRHCWRQTGSSAALASGSTTRTGSAASSTRRARSCSRTSISQAAAYLALTTVCLTRPPPPQASLSALRCVGLHPRQARIPPSAWNSTSWCAATSSRCCCGPNLPSIRRSWRAYETTCATHTRCRRWCGQRRQQQQHQTPCNKIYNGAWMN